MKETILFLILWSPICKGRKSQLNLNKLQDYSVRDMVCGNKPMSLPNTDGRLEI